MAWENLPTDFTDAVWVGLKRYNQIYNEDGTTSFQDVTLYTGREKSFFGAKDANRINEAMNIIMAMLENGTDLYELFQEYFAGQQELFTEKSDTQFADFLAYIENLEQQGDTVIEGIKTDYRTEMDDFQAVQEQLFNVWFDAVRDKLAGDVAANLQNQVDNLDDKMDDLGNEVSDLEDEVSDLTTKVDGFVNKQTVFSEDGKHITETAGDTQLLVTFNDDGSITEQQVKGGEVILTKKTTFSADGLEIKEEIL